MSAAGPRPGVLRRELGDDLNHVQDSGGREHGINPPAPVVEILQGPRRRPDRDDLLHAAAADPVSLLDQLEFLGVLQGGVGLHIDDLPPRDEDQAEIVVHKDDLLERIGLAGPVLLGQADAVALAAPQDSPVFQPDFRGQGRRRQQNQKTAGHPGRRPPTVP